MRKKTRQILNQNSKNELLLQKQEEYSGIIPHPSIVEGYERNCPGATDRILAMTENQLKSSQELAKMEQENINECRKEVVKSGTQRDKRGQFFGFIILLVMLIGGFMLVFLGKDIGGYSSIAGSIALGIGSAIWNRKLIEEQNKE